MALALVASGIGGVAMAQQSNAPGTIVRKELLTAAIAGQPPQLLTEGSAFFEPAGAKVVQFDNASSDAPATFVAFYLLGSDDQRIIEMLQ
jgi:hypothetical protein